MQKKFSPKIIQISDIVEWYSKKEINFSPKYQRNSVWNENAKSYLIDTILRGMPIPPIFLRQHVDINTRKNNREVIDGQQRLRTIIEYVYDETFSLMKKHNSEFGDLKYSELEDDVRKDVLQYEIIAQVINEDEDTIIYDMFSRLNSNNVVLNKQELRNAKYWGDFKVLVYQLTSDYRSFFEKNKIFSDKEFSRMKDAEFINSLIIVLLKGIVSETPSYIDQIYTEYDSDFYCMDNIRNKFIFVMSEIDNILSRYERKTAFNNKNYFYTLFSFIAAMKYDLDGLDDNLIINIKKYDSNNELHVLIDRFLVRHETALSKDSPMLAEKREIYKEFDGLHRKQTTDKGRRIKRINTFLHLLEE